MNYQETLNWLFAQLPMYQREGQAAYKANLDNTLQLDEYFRHPHKNFKTIHVAGTNGKGSVSHMLASILQQAGYKTGLYTSPHLKDFRERIKINGEMVSEQYVIDFVRHHADLFSRVKPSFFEMTVAMAFKYFADSQVDIAVIEVGLGGRLDSTNIITPLASVITNISFDHMALLGNTLEKIASEKAGIIKEGIPVVAIDEENGAFSVIERTAKEKNAPVYGLKSQELTILKKCENTIDFSINSRYYKISNLKVKSYASYQVQNAALAVLAVKVLLPEVSQDVIREGIVKMYWPGRMEEIAENVYVDGAHNPGAVHQIYNSLTDSDKEWLLLFAVCSDKDYSEMIRVLGRLPWKRIYITKIDSARGADTAAVKQCFKEEAAGCPIYEDDNARTAFETALKDREYENLLCLGSLYLAGEIKDFATTIF